MHTPPVPPADPHVLIVDDEADLRMLARLALDTQLPLPARVSDTGSGQDAITQCRDEQVDVLVLDLHMPGVTGLDVLVAVLDLPRSPCVVAWSADVKALGEARTRGAHLSVTKSGALGDLADAVRECLANCGSPAT